MHLAFSELISKGMVVLFPDSTLKIPEWGLSLFLVVLTQLFMITRKPIKTELYAQHVILEWAHVRSEAWHVTFY